MPSTLRGLLIVVGSVILLAGWFGWPLESGWVRFFEGVGGLLMMMFGIFGVRRTLSKVVEKVGGTVDDSEMIDGIVFDQKAAKAAGSKALLRLPRRRLTRTPPRDLRQQRQQQTL